MRFREAVMEKHPHSVDAEREPRAGNPQHDTLAPYWIVAGAMLFAAGLGIWKLDGVLDAQVDLAMRMRPGNALVPAIAFLSQLGGAAVMIPVALAGVGLLLYRRHVASAIWLVATVGGGRIVEEVAKALIARERPSLAQHLVAVRSASFPSSHSAGTMMTCLAIILALNIGRGGQLLAAIFILAIGLSRIMLGVHWPSDVLSGWGLGLAWVAALSSWKPALR